MPNRTAKAVLFGILKHDSSILTHLLYRTCSQPTSARRPIYFFVPPGMLLTGAARHLASHGLYRRVPQEAIMPAEWTFDTGVVTINYAEYAEEAAPSSRGYPLE